MNKETKETKETLQTLLDSEEMQSMEVDITKFPPQIDLKERIAHNVAIKAMREKIKSLME